MRKCTGLFALLIVILVTGCQGGTGESDSSLQEQIDELRSQMEELDHFSELQSLREQGETHPAPVGRAAGRRRTLRGRICGDWGATYRIPPSTPMTGIAFA